MIIIAEKKKWLPLKWIAIVVLAVVPDDAHAAGGSSDAFGAVDAVVSLLVAASPNDRARSVDAPTLVRIPLPSPCYEAPMLVPFQ